MKSLLFKVLCSFESEKHKTFTFVLDYNTVQKSYSTNTVYSKKCIQVNVTVNVPMIVFG